MFRKLKIMILAFHITLRVLASCAVDRGFDQRSDQTKDYKIYICTWRKRIKAKTS